MEISIIGAGTAGLTAAYLFAKMKYQNVDIYEKSKKLGWRYLNTVQSLRNYDEKIDIIKYLNDMGINLPSKLYYPIYKQIRYFPDDTNILIKSTDDKPSFYNFIRGNNANNSLDRYLYEEAIRSGVRFHFGHSISYNRNSRDHFIISARGSSHIKKGFELKGIDYQGISNSFPENTIVVIFDNDIAPAGYISLLPFPMNKGKFFRISLSVEWDPIKRKYLDTQDTYKKLMKKNYIRENLLKNFKLENIILVYARCGFINHPKENIIYIGEEFGALDSALGYGNVNAFKTAIAAVNVIREKNSSLFMQQIRNSGVIDNIGKGVIRRISMRITSNNNYIKKAKAIIRKTGHNLDINQYMHIKRLESVGWNKIEKIIKSIIHRIMIFVYLKRF